MWICKYAAAHALIGLLGNDICADAVVAGFDMGTFEDESTPFAAGVEVGRVSSDPIKEASGLASSRVNANVLYTHNDRGDDARIFAIRSDGKHIATLNLKSALHVDYEDIAVGPGPLTDTSYIYVGDIVTTSTKMSLETISLSIVYQNQISAPISMLLVQSMSTLTPLPWPIPAALTMLRRF